MRKGLTGKKEASSFIQFVALCRLDLKPSVPTVQLARYLLQHGAYAHPLLSSPSFPDLRPVAILFGYREFEGPFDLSDAREDSYERVSLKRMGHGK